MIIFGEPLHQMNLNAQFLDDFPHIEWKLWPEENIKEKKTPRDSKLSKKDLISLSARELYNFIRCLRTHIQMHTLKMKQEECF